MAKRDASAFVRMTEDDKRTIREAIARQLIDADLVGAKLSVPDFMLSAALEKARSILGNGPRK